jgi:hypothetical protein
MLECQTKNLLFEARICWPHTHVSLCCFLLRVKPVCISPLQLLRTIYLFDNQFRIYKYFLKSTIFVFLSCKKHRSLFRKSFTFIPTYHTHIKMQFVHASIKFCYNISFTLRLTIVYSIRTRTNRSNTYPQHIYTQT